MINIPWPSTFEVLRDVGIEPPAYDDYGHRLVTPDVVQFTWNGWLQQRYSREAESTADNGQLDNTGRFYTDPTPTPLLSGDRLRNVATGEVWQVIGIEDMGGLGWYQRLSVERVREAGA